MTSNGQLRPAGRSRQSADSNAPQGVPGREGVLGRVVARLAVLASIGALALTAAAPAALAADPLTLSTAYPAVVVAPGAKVTFNVSVTTDTPQRVALALSGAPAAWKASLHGGGYVIDAVQTDGTEAATVRVDVDVPADATGTTRMTLTGTAGSSVAALALEIRVAADVAGDVTIVSDVPSLQGPSSQTFNFNLRLSNDTAQDLTFSVNAQGPTGWVVEANLTGQSQAASAIIKAGSSSAVTVSAEPPPGTPAGTYDIGVVAIAGERTISGSLQVIVTGSYDLAISTDGGRLNGRGAAGEASPIVVTVTNSGTAAVTNVKMAATGPTGWDFTFDQPTIASIGEGETVNVKTEIKPAGDAIAGDYNVTVTATGDQSTRDSMTIRFTVETSILWGIIGGGLIAIVAAGVWWVFQRYGRR
ncbi:MAG: hypothetical protein HW391_1378 [Chloroflexi bacterium]|nr:hypothetical protein [Chloroflexota bacterium]